MNNSIITDKKKPKFKKWEKFFYLAVLFGTIFLIVNGFNDYKEIMDNPKSVKGVVARKDLYSNGNGVYYWNIYYQYKVDNEIYESKLIDSPYSKDYSIGDSLYVYYDNFDYNKSLGFKKPIKIQIRPNLLDFMLHDSINGYLLIMVVLLILVYTLPVLIHLIFIVLIGLFLKIINKHKSSLFFEKGFNKLKDITLVRIDNFIDRW